MNVIEIESGTLVGNFEAGVAFHGPGSRGRGRGAYRVFETVHAGRYSARQDASHPTGVLVVLLIPLQRREPPRPEGWTDPSPLDPFAGAPVRYDLARAALRDACRAQGMDGERGAEMALAFPDHPASKKTQIIADALVRWYRAGAHGDLVPC